MLLFPSLKLIPPETKRKGPQSPFPFTPIGSPVRRTGVNKKNPPAHFPWKVISPSTRFDRKLMNVKTSPQSAVFFVYAWALSGSFCFKPAPPSGVKMQGIKHALSWSTESRFSSSRNSRFSFSAVPFALFSDKARRDLNGATRSVRCKPV